MKRNEVLQLRKLLEILTKTLSDQEAISVITCIKRWKPGVNYVKDVDRVTVVECGKLALYKCLQSHTSQDLYKPSSTTSSLWVKIDVEHSGTINDPIPYEINMIVYNSKYYIEDNILYLCTRDSDTALQNKASELVGHYFNVVE